jgi:predicted  nucleic acid-binding Zn ribbon protein
MKSNENKIFEKLSKFKEVKKEQLGKENLGAIEDSINQVKEQLKENAFVLGNTVESLNSEIVYVVDQISGAIDGLRSIIADHQSIYDENESQFLETARELDDLGIEYDNPFPEIGSDFNDYISYANEILNIESSLTKFLP